ncbi:ABC transporter permease [Mucilaginibacter sp. S1162]|uniref:ABC transporter permease n=1 Tax=Mucilaginibacter humi TaxID=2732510 RepID=A0ABX1W4K0_9SPHI|nr:ABC transporter permease [Mucilaginibacter humi]
MAQIYASHNDELQVVDANGIPVKNFKEQSGVFYTEPSFFNIFKFPLLVGSYASLKDPNNVLLTKEIAETYFGDWTKAMGKTIKLTGYYSMGAALFQFPPMALKVSGIRQPYPQIQTSA